MTSCSDQGRGGHERVEEVVRELGLQHRDVRKQRGGGARHVSEAHRDAEVKSLRVAPEKVEVYTYLDDQQHKRRKGLPMVAGQSHACEHFI